MTGGDSLYTPDNSASVNVNVKSSSTNPYLTSITDCAKVNG